MNIPIQGQIYFMISLQDFFFAFYLYNTIYVFSKFLFFSFNADLSEFI